MALSRDQSIALYGTEAYTAWDENSALEDAKKKGLVGAGGGTSQQYGGDFASQYVDSIQSEINRQAEFIQKQFKDNPFAFDEELAKKSSTAEYEPYYSEMLEDYLGDIGVKRESIGSEKQLMKALTTTGSGTAGKASREYERAVSSAEQGFAGSGMFFSGIKQRALGGAEVERQYGLQAQARDITQQDRDIGREQKAAIEGGVLQRKNEAWKQYLTPRTMAYKQQFPTGQLNASDYMPPEYLQYT